MDSSGREHKTYPFPSIVVGVGRMGLGVVETLAEDWSDLRSAGDDPTLNNLRLIHVGVGSGDDDQASKWLVNDHLAVSLAKFIEEGDLPTLAVDLVMLRSLGLVRFRNGCYQIAIPVDRGVVDLVENRKVEGDGQELQSEPRRIRYFDWRTLGPDPVVSAQMLRRLTDNVSDVDLFLTPILNRVKGGFGPGTLLTVISRCKAMMEGRDPSPWHWLHSNGVPGKNCECLKCHDCLSSSPARVPCPRNWSSQLRRNDQESTGKPVELDVLAGWLVGSEVNSSSSDVSRVNYLEDFAPAPLPDWDSFRERPDRQPVGSTGMKIHLPARFVPQESDLPAQLDPTHLLWVDWETNGWAGQRFDSAESNVYRPLPASPFRLGLFDHYVDASPMEAQRQSSRLQELGGLAYKGLVRLWIDLQRNRTEEGALANEVERHRSTADAALRQSLEILGELLVKDVLGRDTNSGKPGTDSGWWRNRPRAGQIADRADLPSRPSMFLESLELPRLENDPGVSLLLDNRLAALGLCDARAQAEKKEQRLFHEIPLSEADIANGDDGGESPTGRIGLTTFRTRLNRETRQLFQLDHLIRYRNQPTRQPPRLTVFVVGDVGEPFVRSTMRILLREAHAELIRAYGPIFETFRTGFDRSLNIVPILWMPHPSDAFGGAHRDQNRCEEAAIIDTVQGVRRWVENSPANKRCISQIFINSMVTDNAVLTPPQAIRQTRDFITFLTRNDVSRDEWLRQTSVGPHGEDFFSSFSCLEIGFPVEKSREYLANRLARDSMQWMRTATGGRPPAIDDGRFAPNFVNSMTIPVVADLRGQMNGSAGRMAGKVNGLVPDPGKESSRLLEQKFSPALVRELEVDIQKEWRSIVQAQGQMDVMVDALRRESSRQLTGELSELRRLSDSMVQQTAARHGLGAMQAGFERLRQVTRAALVRGEEKRLDRERLCTRHKIPDTSPIAHARESVVAAVRQMPDLLPMNLGLVVWTALAAVFGSMVPWAVSMYFGLPARPGVMEFILGPLGPLLGTTFFAVPVWLILRGFRLKRVNAVKAAVNQMADETATVVKGTGKELKDEPRASVRSFFEARLELAAALAGRGFSLGVQNQAASDIACSNRIFRSVDIQEQQLERRVQELGARPSRGDGLDRRSRGDDVSKLFADRAGTRPYTLVRPEKLHDYYDERYGNDDMLRAVIPGLVSKSGGFDDWRKTAVLADSNRILKYCRERFASIVDTPIADQAAFAADVGKGIVHFVSRNYSNIGFGAKFIGYEGMDPDGINKMADATLLLSESLERLYQKARLTPGALPTTDTMSIMTPALRENVAYILSLVQGIRAHSIRNLQRFESYHERIRMPDDRMFPLTGEAAGPEGPINILSDFSQKTGAADSVAASLASNRSTETGTSVGYPSEEGNQQT